MDIVVILGAQNQVDGTLSPMAVARAEGGLAEYRCRPGAMMLITGGYGHFNCGAKPHAHFVADYLVGKGFQHQDLLPLAISANTVEDAVIVRSIVHDYPWTTLHIVTSEHHLNRARTIFEHFFPAAQLATIATPMAVPANRVEEYLAHEFMSTEKIRRQGGIVVGKTLIESYETCPSTPELIELLPRQERADQNLVSIYQ